VKISTREEERVEGFEIRALKGVLKQVGGTWRKLHNLCPGKGKGKFHHITGHEGQGEE
jgi:hypothetical protein